MGSKSFAPLRHVFGLSVQYVFTSFPRSKKKSIRHFAPALHDCKLLTEKAEYLSNRLSNNRFMITSSGSVILSEGLPGRAATIAVGDHHCIALAELAA